jgi:hypothetical protein
VTSAACHPSSTVRNNAETAEVARVLDEFVRWLATYGETSFDHQSFFAGPIGGRAKSLYYRNHIIGTAAVAPMIFVEGLLPSARRLFHQRTRFPIADAHYAMGFGFLYEANGNTHHLAQAVHFLDELKKSRCPGFDDYCWGYPFDWVTRNGVIKAGTPLITTTPYCYEACLQIADLVEQNSDLQSLISDLCPLEIAASIARHAANDIKDFSMSQKASSCSYTPYDKGGVINAAAYRAFLLTQASQLFSNEAYWNIAERNLNFVLESQNADGSWYYAADGVRNFVDHYHTCFVLKALAKIDSMTGYHGCRSALSKGVDYYLRNLFADDGLPKPFAKAPRLTVYKRELYDCAECVNLCLLLKNRFPQLESTLQNVLTDILRNWIKPNGSFRSRRLHFGWDNVAMHRWGQSQMFRSLALYAREQRGRSRHVAENGLVFQPGKTQTI